MSCEPVVQDGTPQQSPEQFLKGEVLSSCRRIEVTKTLPVRDGRATIVEVAKELFIGQPEAKLCLHGKEAIYELAS